MKNIFAINGSASRNSSNEKLIRQFAELSRDHFRLTLSPELKELPRFDPELSVDNTPKEIEEFRNKIECADIILICTPEYLFSIPSGLKNMLEWCVSTTVFSGKATALITASVNGEKGHKELKLIMKTLMARFTPQTTLLIRGFKGKITETGQIVDKKMLSDIKRLITNMHTGN